MARFKGNFSQPGRMEQGVFRIGPCYSGSFLAVISANQRAHGQANMVVVPLPGQALRQ